MPTPTDTLWERDQHTAAKHQMLEGYLQAWFPIIASSFRRGGLTYVDAFAGPGEYIGGEIGSPLLALRHARRPDVSGHGSPIRLLFIEAREDRFEHLRGLIDTRHPPASRPQNWTLRQLHGRCEDLLIPALAEIRAGGAPLFVNFDGWGVDTPLSLVRHVGRYPSAEVLITFQAQWFVRFATQQDVAAGDRVFGGRDWRPLATCGTPPEKKRALTDLYRGKLGEAGFGHSLVFEMVDEGGHELLLVFGTTSDLGLEKMKDAMWSVDCVHGQHFRDPRDIDQLAFEISDKPDLTLLKRQLGAVLENGPATLDTLKQFALRETAFKGTHAPVAVAELEQAGKVECERTRRHEDFVVCLAAPTLF